MFLFFIPTLAYLNPELSEDKNHLLIQINPEAHKDHAHGWKNFRASQVGKFNETV